MKIIDKKNRKNSVINKKNAKANRFEHETISK